MVSALRVFVALVAFTSTTLAHPIARDDVRVIGARQSSVMKRQTTTGSEFDVLAAGNKAFREADPALLQKLADDGQAPPFMFLGCSDSRVSEGTIFQAKPGTLFTQRNIANQFQANDPNTQSVLAYAVSELGVKHIIVMGHYGCGGVAAAIASAPTSSIDAANGAVQTWIQPIRDIFASSSRAEIVELRDKLKGNATLAAEEPDIREPGFRALVEENVKVGVARIASNSVITNHYALLATAASNSTSTETKSATTGTSSTSTGTSSTPTGTSSTTVITSTNSAVTVNGHTYISHVKRSGEAGPAADMFIHGWVYDIENGEIRDLGISVGPPGKAIPPVPFAALSSAVAQTEAVHNANRGFYAKDH